MTRNQPAQPIILYCFGPAFDLPEASPFCMKTEIQLRMAGLPFEKDFGGFPTAPKGKLPYIKDGETIVADSTLIRQHIEWSYSADLDAPYGEDARALAWAVERMLEDHLGWVANKYRWLDPVNFAKGPAHFFDDAPEAIRDKLRQDKLAMVASRLDGHGITRHTDEDILYLGTRSLTSFAKLLGDKPFLLGETPCGTDATACGILAQLMNPYFDSDLRKAAEKLGNLRPYVDRMLARFYPDFAEKLAA